MAFELQYGRSRGKVLGPAVLEDTADWEVLDDLKLCTNHTVHCVRILSGLHAHPGAGECSDGKAPSPAAGPPHVSRSCDSEIKMVQGTVQHERSQNKRLKRTQSLHFKQKATLSVHDDRECLSTTSRLRLSVTSGHFQPIAHHSEESAELHTSMRPTLASDDYSQSIPASRASSTIEQPFEADRV